MKPGDILLVKLSGKDAKARNYGIYVGREKGGKEHLFSIFMDNRVSKLKRKMFHFVEDAEPYQGDLRNREAMTRYLKIVEKKIKKREHSDIEQLEMIGEQYADRQQFLAELTLDPPIASGDLAGSPQLDDDFLILSTIHSAKGQEWKHVFVLNVNDGNVPNEFACGEPARIEEERRLLYVAMTRARESLSLMRPLKYWVPEQARHGDKHVYGAKSRFLTPAVMKHLKVRTYAGLQQASYRGAINGTPVIDVRERASSMF